ncbi:MAG: DUF1002 domain-containing protein [Lachnospiraceae bacterium]
MKKFIFCLIIFVILVGGIKIKSQAANPGDKVVVLGADLSEEQRKTVLNLMDITEEELVNYTVITVTNADEHQYLGSYISSSVIGSKSLSSVLLTKGNPGDGVLVTTKNINYCTTGMYRNALLTAGLEDTKVVVVGPTNISGTAALIGAIKAYEYMSDTTVSNDVFDAALNELITTGELVNEGSNGTEMEELVAFLKGKIASGEVETEEDILNLIEESEEKFNVTLTEDQKAQILSLMEKIKKLGLDPEVLLDQASDLYEKYGTEIFENVETAIKDSVKTSITKYFTNVVDYVSSFISNIFSK